VLAGRDLLGCAQTGTGKTAAFALPMLQRLSGPRDGATAPAGGSRRPAGPRALILVPTRELALQVGESFGTYGRHLRVSGAVIFGGVGQGPQVEAVRRGADVVVATPGRLLDLMDQGHINLGAVEIFVLDEADRMLDMGFIKPIRQVISKLPVKRQNLMFSATMPPDIAQLADQILPPLDKDVSLPVEQHIRGRGVELYLVEVGDCAGVAHEHEALALQVGVEAPRVGDDHRLPGERHHRVERFVLGDVLEDGGSVRGTVAHVVDLGFHAHARTLHIVERV